METEKDILGKCFNSSSDLWQSFINQSGRLNILYYPSAGEDLRPFVFSKNECLEYMGLNNTDNKYAEPDFFIFSDYFPFPNSRFFDSTFLHWDDYTLITIEDYCEIVPSDEYKYNFNKEYVDLNPSPATGKAIFFRAKIKSHTMQDSFYRYAIYFFYENVNLIDQLFLKNKLNISHIVWKRDGSGLGGGRVFHNFLYPVSDVLNSKFYFIWTHYLDSEIAELSYNNVDNKRFPIDAAQHLPNDFSIKLIKKKVLNWEKLDKMNLYFRE